MFRGPFTAQQRARSIDHPSTQTCHCQYALRVARRSVTRGVGGMETLRGLPASCESVCDRPFATRTSRPCPLEPVFLPGDRPRAASGQIRYPIPPWSRARNGQSGPDLFQASLGRLGWFRWSRASSLACPRYSGNTSFLTPVSAKGIGHLGLQARVRRRGQGGDRGDNSGVGGGSRNWPQCSRIWQT